MEVFNTYSKMFISVNKDFKLGQSFDIRIAKTENLSNRKKIDLKLELRYLPYEVGSKAIVRMLDVYGFYIPDDSEVVLNKTIAGEEAKNLLFPIAKDTIDIAVKNLYKTQLSNLPSFGYSGVNLRLNDRKESLELVVVKHLHQSQFDFWKRISKRSHILLPENTHAQLEEIRTIGKRRSYPAYDSNLT